MALLKQVLVTLVFLAVAGAGWLYLSPVPGRYLLADDSPLPDPLRPLVASLSSADDEPPVGATPRAGRGAGAVPLVVVDAAVVNVTRDQLRAIGTGEAVRSVAVYPEVSGIVTAINFQPGDVVEEGDVLATLQNETETLALDRARITLAAARAQVERYQTLSTSSITAVQLEEVQRAAETAELDVRSAQISLDRRNILSPIAGRVGLTAVQPGALVGTQSLIATIDDRSRLKVVFNAPEAFMSELSVGHPVEATPTTRTGRSYTGEIAALDSRIDEASRTLRTEALIDNEADDLRPGMSFSVEIAFPGEEFLSVDPLAIQWERAGSYVWVVREERIAKAPIRIIERNVERVLVASEDLQADDAVVTEGVAQLREDLPVRVQNDVDLPPVPDAPDDGVPSAEAEPVAAPAVGAETGTGAEGESPAADGAPAQRRLAVRDPQSGATDTVR